MIVPPSASRTAVAGLAAAIALGSVGAAFGAGPEEPRYTLRLLASGGMFANGTYEFGVAIDMEPDWKTYWRNPGDSGIAPRFDFSASRNVETVEVAYPAPERFDDGFGESLGYQTSVVFPLSVTPERADEPVVLRVDAQFGVCLDICIPAEASAHLMVEPDSLLDLEGANIIDRFARRVPAPEADGQVLALERFARVGEEDGSPVYEISVRLVDPAAFVDVFAEGIGEWYVPQPVPVESGASEDEARFRLVLAKDPPENASLRLTVVNGETAVEADRPLR